MPHGEAIRQSQLFLSYGSFDRILSDVRTKAPTLQGMRTDFRIGFFVGIAATLAISVYCYELWQQERQVLRHSENLFRRNRRQKLVRPRRDDRVGLSRSVGQ